MSFYRGTLAEYNAWHDPIKVEKGYPIVGRQKGVLMPGNQQTTDYSVPIQHPDETDDYIWSFVDYPTEGEDEFTRAEVETAGWFPVAST